MTNKMDRKVDIARGNADRKAVDIYDFSDTSKMRGAWHLLLVLTSKTVTMTRRIVVCEQLREYQAMFPCLKCKIHFAERLNAHPPEAEIDDEDGLFKWTVEFMNSINKRLGKPLYDYTRLYIMFHDIGYKTCAEDCGENAPKPIPIQPNNAASVSASKFIRYNPYRNI